MTRLPALVFTGLLAIAALTIGCGDDEDPGRATVAASDCPVGEPPDYHVSGSRPTEIIGCAELGVSGKPAEFVVEQPKRGRPGVLVSPVYGDNASQDYLFVPTTAFVPSGKLDPITQEIPKQGVRGYELVLWGEAADEEVSAETAEEQFSAVTFEVPAEFGNERLRRVFVVELPADAACDEITVRDGAGDEEVVPRNAALCERAEGTQAAA